jgi:hypothetical protein
LFVVAEALLRLFLSPGSSTHIRVVGATRDI